MKSFKDWSIPHKLNGIIMLVCVLALFIAGMTFTINEVQRSRTVLVNRTQSLAEVFALQSAPSMLFRDDRAAEENLAALQAQPDVISGSLWLDDGTLLARYVADQLARPVQRYPTLAAGAYWQSDRLVVVRAVQEPGQALGFLVLQVSLDPLKIELIRGAVTSIVILLLALSFAGLLATRLQRMISNPIQRLSQGVEAVTATGNYNIRVEQSSNDELGILTVGFNRMLSQIQQQEDQLASHKNNLERLVKERTEELEQTMVRVNRLAFYDALTGLPNRTLFRERIDLALGHARHEKAPLTIFFLDIDRFKRVNDTFGHPIGDLMLKEVARRLIDCFKGITGQNGQNCDHCISRLGGDEFNVLLPEKGEAPELAQLAQKVIQNIAEPMNLEGYEMVMTTSIGISVYPEDGDTVDALIKNADTAMYHAKTEGRNNYQFYRESMNETALKRLAMEADLRRALENDELEVYYQPQVDSSGSFLLGAEALVRWNHPQRGVVSPVEFIPVAEESGVNKELTRNVLHQACRQAHIWRQGRPAFRMSINLSGYQFVQQDLVEMVAEALRDYPLDPSCLELELTESSLLENRQETIAILSGLKRLGVHLAVDDFGTGYSSLVYLKTFPIDTLKIDRSFVRDIPSDPNDAAIARAIGAMAKSLALDLVAEGVENHQQLVFLQQLDCQRLQGFLFGHPVACGDFFDQLDQNGIRYSALVE